MKNLGLSPEDIQNIYSKSSDESSSTSHREVKPASRVEKRSAADISPTKKKLDDSDSEEPVSSAWDEDASEKSQHQQSSKPKQNRSNTPLYPCSLPTVPDHCKD